MDNYRDNNSLSVQFLKADDKKQFLISNYLGKGELISAKPTFHKELIRWAKKKHPYSSGEETANE